MLSKNEKAIEVSEQRKDFEDLNTVILAMSHDSIGHIEAVLNFIQGK